MGDFANDARDLIQQTLGLANQELGQLEYEQKCLEHRIAQLREFLRLGDALLHEGRPGLPSLPALLPPERPSAAAQAAAVLADVGHPMSIQDIFTEAVARNGLHGKQPKEAIRTGIRDHPNVFRRVKRGVYGLTTWDKPARVATGD